MAVEFSPYKRNGDTVKTTRALQTGSWRHLSVIWLLTYPTLGHTNSDPILTPQMVVDRTLSESLEAKTILLQEPIESRNLLAARGLFDSRAKLEGKYELSRAVTFSPLTNPEERLFSLTASWMKSWSFGLSSEFSYSRQNQSSELNAFSISQSTPEEQTLDVWTFRLQQELWQNAFGFADRQRVRIEEERLGDLPDSQVESYEELVLEALQLYWQAYIAQENLKESLDTRDRFRRLTETVKNKSRFGFTSPGELARTLADQEGQEQRVRDRSAAFLDATQKLFQRLELAVPEDVEFRIGEPIPRVPELTSVDPKVLRPYRLAESQLKISEMEMALKRSELDPKLSLVLQAQSTGRGETPDRAFSDGLSLQNPVYFAGLTFETLLGSEKRRGDLAAQAATTAEKRLKLREIEKNLTFQLASSERQVRSLYLIAQSAMQAVGHREKAAREMEQAYRQGRTEILGVVDALNTLSLSRSQKIASIGNYHIALDQLAAVRDQLVQKRMDEDGGL